MRTSKADLLLRVYQVLEWKLAGAQFHDLRGEALKIGWGVSDGQLWRYSQMADKLLASRIEKDRDNLVNHHIARRELVYNRSVATGNYGAAIAALRDLATLQGIWPAEKHEHSGPGGGPIEYQHTLTDEQRETARGNILAQLGRRSMASVGNPEGDGDGSVVGESEPHPDTERPDP